MYMFTLISKCKCFIIQVWIQMGGGIGGPDSPWKITSYMGFYRNWHLDPPWKNVRPPSPPPLENVEPPLKKCCPDCFLTVRPGPPLKKILDPHMSFTLIIALLNSVNSYQKDSHIFTHMMNFYWWNNASRFTWNQKIIWVLMRLNLSSGFCEQQRRIPAYASRQTNQCLCYSLSGKYHIKTCYKRNFIFLASLCS